MLKLPQFLPVKRIASFYYASMVASSLLFAHFGWAQSRTQGQNLFSTAGAAEAGKSQNLGVRAETSLGSLRSQGVLVSTFIHNQSELVIDFQQHQEGESFLRAGLMDPFSTETLLRGQSIGLSLKQYITESEFIRVGLERKTISVDMLTNTFPTLSQPSKLVTTSLQGSITSFVLGIGNSWTWNNFSIGIDWARIHQPISSNISKTSVSPSDNDSAERLASARKVFFENPNIQVGINIGLVF